LGLTPQVALIITYVICVAIAYFLQSRLVFRSRSKPRYIAFLVVYVVAYLTNGGLLGLLIRNNIDPVVAQGLLTFVSAAVSYVGLSIVFSGQLPLLRISVGPPLGPRRSDS